MHYKVQITSFLSPDFRNLWVILDANFCGEKVSAWWLMTGTLNLFSVSYVLKESWCWTKQVWFICQKNAKLTSWADPSVKIWEVEVKVMRRDEHKGWKEICTGQSNCDRMWGEGGHHMEGSVKCQVSKRNSLGKKLTDLDGRDEVMKRIITYIISFYRFPPFHL